MQNEPPSPSWRPREHGFDEPPPEPASSAAAGPANLRRTPEGAPAPALEPGLSPHAPRAATGISRNLVLVVAGAALAGGLVSGLLVALLAHEDSVPAEQAKGNVQALTVEHTSAIADAAARARPSVVRIESTKRATNGGTEQDIGSGVVLDQEGHVVTNAHVVLNTDSLKIVLADGTERPAVLVGHDYPFTDLAVLQIGPGNLAPVEPGDSEALRLGESVIAIGNPLAEFDGSVSVGVVSGLDRVRTFDSVRQEDLIQTDAAVNNGNSGGALVNLRGQFVGMPTAVIRQSRSGNEVEGIAFALPSNRVLEIARTIIDTGGQYPRPSLQLEHSDLTAEVLAKMSRPAAREGAVVAAILRDGAADAAGIQAGDIITRIGDNDVNGDNPLFNVLMRFNPGDAARVVLNRNGRIIETEVRLAKRS